jgi:secretion/DNA translocation related TadE-like protein
VRPGERGSATITTLAGIGVVAFATAVALAVGVLTQVRHRADAAADAAALAAAASAIQGAPDACERGRELANRNGAQLIRCTVVNGIADVTVTMRAPSVLAAFGRATARARAGPAGAAG